MRQWRPKWGLGFCLVVGAVAPAFAQPGFDGTWSVVIVTESGPCSRTLRHLVAIENGGLRYRAQLGVMALDVAGRVDGRGMVTVRITRGQDWVQATGRLAEGRGSGTWKSPSLNCSGHWSAERR
jgi:hypothetical protein